MWEAKYWIRNFAFRILTVKDICSVTIWHLCHSSGCFTYTHNHSISRYGTPTPSHSAHNASDISNLKMKLVNFASSMAYRISVRFGSVCELKIEHDNRPASDLYKRCCIDLPLAAHAKYLSKHVWLNRRKIVFPIHFVCCRAERHAQQYADKTYTQDIYSSPESLFIFIMCSCRIHTATSTSNIRPYVCSMRASCFP